MIQGSSFRMGQATVRRRGWWIEGDRDGEVGFRGLRHQGRAVLAPRYGVLGARSG